MSLRLRLGLLHLEPLQRAPAHVRRLRVIGPRTPSSPSGFSRDRRLTFEGNDLRKDPIARKETSGLAPHQERKEFKMLRNAWCVGVTATSLLLIIASTAL